MTSMMRYIFEQIPRTTEFGPSLIGAVLIVALKAFAIAIAPIFAVTFIIALLVESIQTGGNVSFESISPKFEKLNPLEGLKKMFSMKSVVELIKSLLKILIVFWITWVVIKDQLPFVVGMIESSPWNALVLGGEIAYTIAIRVGIFYLFIAVLDYFYQRYEFMKNMMMTKQEIKEEYKRLEGDPQIKQRMRDLQRQMSQSRMMGSVPGSDVVVTNPTHLAVAISYDASKMKAPRVLAKGRYLIAEEIKSIAESYFIPIIENETLAREIYKTTKVGGEINNELYQAVAEILAFVYKIKKERKKKHNEWLGPTKGVRSK